MSEELKPCAHCGGEAVFDHDDHGWTWIVCKNCGISTNCRVSCGEDCRPLLAEDWNRRAIPQNSTELARRAERDAVIEECAQAVRRTEIVEAENSQYAQLGDAAATLDDAISNVLALKGK